MASQQQDDSANPPNSPSRLSSAQLSVSPSSYLTVPNTRPPGVAFQLPGPTTPDALLDTPVDYTPTFASLPHILEPARSRDPSPDPEPSSPRERFARYPEPILMSVYSATSVDSEQSAYSNPPARLYRVPSFQAMSGSRKITVVCIAHRIGHYDANNKRLRRTR
jgi:hypothetical protein